MAWGILTPSIALKMLRRSSWLSYNPNAWRPILDSGSESGSDDTDVLMSGREMTASKDGIVGLLYPYLRRLGTSLSCVTEWSCRFAVEY
jgi:hypothetical protein